MLSVLLLCKSRAVDAEDHKCAAKHCTAAESRGGQRHRWRDGGIQGGLRWTALTNLIPELIGMTDEDKLKRVS